MRYQSAIPVSILYVIFSTSPVSDVRGQRLLTSPTRMLQLEMESEVRNREELEAARILAARRRHVRLRVKIVAIDELLHRMWKLNHNAMVVPIENEKLVSDIEELTRELRDLTTAY